MKELRLYGVDLNGLVGELLSRCRSLETCIDTNKIRSKHKSSSTSWSIPIKVKKVEDEVEAYCYNIEAANLDLNL